MEALNQVLSWGSPVGISLFFFFSASGVGILLWGFGQLPRSEKQDEEEKAGQALNRS